MSTATDIKYIVRDPDFYGGRPCIADYKISVHDIAIRHRQGYTPDQIVTDLYPELSLSQVYAALLYYYDHQAEIDREIGAEAADISARADADASPLAQRINAAIEERRRQVGG